MSQENEDFFKDAPRFESLEEIQNKTEKWLRIDQSNLDAEALRQTDIFFDCNKLYFQQSRYLRWLMHKQAEVKLYRTQYYQGELPAEVYQKDKLRVRPMKSELGLYLKADKLMQEIDSLVAEAEETVAYLENTMKHVRDRGFNIKTSIDFRMFLMGQ